MKKKVSLILLVFILIIPSIFASNEKYYTLIIKNRDISNHNRTQSITWGLYKAGEKIKEIKFDKTISEEKLFLDKGNYKLIPIKTETGYKAESISFIMPPKTVEGKVSNYLEINFKMFKIPENKNTQKGTVKRKMKKVSLKNPSTGDFGIERFLTISSVAALILIRVKLENKNNKIKGETK